VDMKIRVMMIIFLLFAANVAASVYIYKQVGEQKEMYDELLNFDLVCIAEKCSEWVSGNAWAATYCYQTDGGESMDCTFSVNEQEVTLPLVDINTSSLRSCIEKRCTGQILVKSINVEEVIRK